MTNAVVTSRIVLLLQLSAWIRSAQSSART
jgi:hypothetical protein